jgi:hypothetical protein
MAWATEPSPSPAAYPSPNPFYLGNVLANLVSNYQQGQQGQQATQQNDYRLKQDQQLLDQSKAFADGVPKNPDGTTNISAVMDTLAEKGDTNAISALLPLIQQQQNLQGANAPDPILGGGSIGATAPTGSDPVGVVVGAETGGKNEQQSPSTKDVNNNYGAGGGNPAEGYFQIIDPTWREYAPKAGVDVDKYPSAIDAPYAVQAAVAQQIPINQWGPKTVAALNAQFPGLNDRETLGQAESQYGGKGTQVASAGASDAPAYASPDKPSIPPVSAAAGSSIPRENASTAVGAVGGAPQQSQGGPLAANNPAWAGLNASLPVGPSGAPSQTPAAPAPRAPARPFQGSVASIASAAGIPPQIAANIAKAVGVAPGAPLTPEQAQRAQLYVKNYAQRTGQQPPTAAVARQAASGGQGQPPASGPLVPQIRLPGGFTDPMAAVQAINQDINRYAKFTAGQGGEVARERIRNLEWQRDQILKQSTPQQGRPGEMYLDPRNAQPIAQVPYPGGSLTPAAIDQGAEMYYQTGRFPTGMGRGVQGAGNIQMIMDRAQELHPNDPIESWPARQQAFAANTAGERTLSTRAANFTLAENSASSVMPRVIEASRSVDRTKYPDINKIIEMAKVGTGDPNMIRFGIAAETLAQAYATALTPVGKSTVSMQDHARELMNKAWSQGQIEAAVDQMGKEISSEKQSLNKTRAEFDLPPLKEEDSSSGTGQGGGSGQFAAPSGVTSSGIKWSVH